MKYLFSSLFVLTIVLSTGCNSANPTTVTESGITLNARDKEALTKLIRDMYEWHENTERQADFQPITKTESDSVYSGLDWKTYDKQLRAIRSSGYFSPEFIASYEKIAHYIDDELKSGRTTWYVGEISPFGDDSNPWCKCQDVPNDSFWNDIELSNYNASEKEVTFTWSWGGDFSYKVAVSRTTEKLKISYLEGFDSKLYLK